MESKLAFKELDSKLLVKEIAHGSPEYAKAVELRKKILKANTMGGKFTKEDLDPEISEMHFAAFLDDQLVASAILTKLSDEVVKMRQVCVDDRLQGKGIGRELVKYLEVDAREKGFKRMVLQGRKTIYKFYERLDYVVEGDEFVEAGIVQYKMMKQLRPKL